MLTKLRLERFKNFIDAELSLGPLTILVGTNASGKSNVRDAFRFLHGIGRGYRVAEIIGEKWGEGGVLQWRGIRGGTRETAYYGSRTFTLSADFSFAGQPPVTYIIEVEPDAGNLGSRVVRESLYSGETMLFDSHPAHIPTPQDDPQHIMVRIIPGGSHKKWPVERFIADQPVLSRIGDELKGRRDAPAAQVREVARDVLDTLASMRFLDLHPEAMRSPSLPGQIVLGDRGENLSSVLQAIYADDGHKGALVQWLQDLTPMDVESIEFSPDQIGRILATLVEHDGRRTSVYSASDGTLRFLAMLAALLTPEPAALYFIEELENGIHPTRLYLLLQLIEQRVSKTSIQVVGTTHSPQLLHFLRPGDDPDILDYATLVYRLPDQQDAHLRRIVDLPSVGELIKRQDIGRLLEAGFLEDAVAFQADPDARVPVEDRVPV